MQIHIDFETFSEASIEATGTSGYAMHPSTRVLCLGYKLEDSPTDIWLPTMPPPIELLEEVRNGSILWAANSMFEYQIWNKVCVRCFGWPEVQLCQMRDVLAQARSHAYHGSLAKVAEQLGTTEKLSTGKEQIKRFSMPQKDGRVIHFIDDPENADEMIRYCVQDVEAELDIHKNLPLWAQDEIDNWKINQEINNRGIQIDTDALLILLVVVENIIKSINKSIKELTCGEVESGFEIAKIKAWLANRGLHLESLDAESVENTLNRYNLSPDERELLILRRNISSASVKKIFSISEALCPDKRVRDHLHYYGAHTGRDAGRQLQPQNLPSETTNLYKCASCGEISDADIVCPFCLDLGSQEYLQWDFAIALGLFASEKYKKAFTDPLSTIGGMIRGLLIPKPGHVFISSDFSAIEGVVTAVLAGEEWQIEVYETHGKIYEATASMITGIPLDEILAHKKETGEHHPIRKKIGKPAALAFGFGGGVGAAKRFGADKYIGSDEEIDAVKKTWREKNRKIVKFWYEMERCAMEAVRNPGLAYNYRDITWYCDDKDLICILPSCRELRYREPIIEQREKWGKLKDTLTFMDSRFGRTETYGGKLTENVVQATARDILYMAMRNVSDAGYDIVLAVHDEIVSEVPEWFADIEEFESLMMKRDDWCSHYPIKAAGGWIGPRFKK